MQVYGTYEDGILTLQRAEYIEDGWYIKFDDDNVLAELFEIPQYGGEENLVWSGHSLTEAFEHVKTLI